MIRLRLRGLCSVFVRIFGVLYSGHLVMYVCNMLCIKYVKFCVTLACDRL